jgi:hypothetical protein
MAIDEDAAFPILVMTARQAAATALRRRQHWHSENQQGRRQH